MNLPYEKLLALSKKSDDDLSILADTMELHVKQVRRVIDDAIAKARKAKERNAIVALSVKYCRDNNVTFPQKEIDNWISKHSD